MYDILLEDLYDKIRRLEEDRHNVDITSGTSELLFIAELTCYNTDVAEMQIIYTDMIITVSCFFILMDHLIVAFF